MPPAWMPPPLEEGVKQAFHMQKEPETPLWAWQSPLLLQPAARVSNTDDRSKDARRAQTPLTLTLPSLQSALAAAEDEAA